MFPRKMMKHLRQCCKKQILQWTAVFLSGVMAVSFAGCRKPMPKKSSTCFIYTDGLLDDLCAIEYLSQRYENAVIMLIDPDALKDSRYASDSVKDAPSFFDTVSRWFKNSMEYREGSDLSGMDLYLLAPLTEFMMILADDDSLRESRALLMAGETDGPEGAGNEWNAAADKEAYRFVTEGMKNLTQVSASECEARFAEKGYPFQADFLEEYRSRMETLQENVYCYDLQAAASASD